MEWGNGGKERKWHSSGDKHFNDLSGKHNGGFKEEHRGTQRIPETQCTTEQRKSQCIANGFKCHHRIILLDAHKRYDDLETFGVTQTCAAGRETQKVYFSWQTERALFCICIQYLTRAIFGMQVINGGQAGKRKAPGFTLHICGAHVSQHVINMRVFLGLLSR